MCDLFRLVPICLEHCRHRDTPAPVPKCLDAEVSLLVPKCPYTNFATGADYNQCQNCRTPHRWELYRRCTTDFSWACVNCEVRKCEAVNCEGECKVGCDWWATRASPRSLPVVMCKLQDPKLRKCYVVNCEVKCEVSCDWLAIPDNVTSSD